MRDNRKIYHHMNQNVLHTKPMQINSSLGNYNQQSMQSTKFSFEGNASHAHRKRRQLFNDLQKGEIDLERNAKELDDILGTGVHGTTG